MGVSWTLAKRIFFIYCNWFDLSVIVLDRAMLFPFSDLTVLHVARNEKYRRELPFRLADTPEDENTSGSSYEICKLRFSKHAFK